MAYSYYYGGFIFFGIALLALMIRFCCQVYGKRSSRHTTLYHSRHALDRARSGSHRVRARAVDDRDRLAAGGSRRVRVVVLGDAGAEGMPSAIVAPPSYDESERGVSAAAPVPPTLAASAAEHDVPRSTPILLYGGIPPPSCDGEAEDRSASPPAYSSIQFEGDREQDEDESSCSVNEPLIS